MARPKRFELLTPRFVVCGSLIRRLVAHWRAPNGIPRWLPRPLDRDIPRLGFPN